MCVVLVILILVYNRSNGLETVVNFLSEMAGAPGHTQQDVLPLLHFMRASFVALPPGIIVCRWIERKNSAVTEHS